MGIEPSIRSATPGPAPGIRGRWARMAAVGCLAWLTAGASHGAAASLPVINREPIDPATLDFEEILFVKRKPYSSDHYYTDINNGTAADRFVPGNGIYIYTIRTQTVRPVITAADLPDGAGFIGKISLSFDATKVLFDFRRDGSSGFRIWEVRVDGTGLRQVSSAPADESAKVKRWGRVWHTDDIHPNYLPDGGIIFSSTRNEHTVLCGGSAALVAPGLFRMDPDGGGVVQLTRSPVSEFCPLVLDDGRVLYHRWEYVDKGARVGKTLWSMNPDGSGAREVYGVADDTTTVYMYPQPMPGTDQGLVCVGTCHYPQGGCVGAIMVIDYRKGVRARGPDPDEPAYIQGDPRYPVTNITPHTFVERRTEPGWHFLTGDGGYVHDRTGRQGLLYTHPYPLGGDRFLVSCKSDPTAHYQQEANAYGLYVIDTTGRHQLLYQDEALSCWHPLPLVPRPVPPRIEPARQPAYAATEQGVCVLTDVYEGMDGIERGTVKWLRVNEAVPRYWATGRRWNPSLSSSAWKAALWPRVQWGVVPVEEDGSAHFLVPANRSIFFQALDGNFRELQRERTYVNYKPGEVRSCTGCHGQGTRATPMPQSTPPLALRHPPSRPQPQPNDLAENGGDGRAGQVIHYPSDIQPIWDARCVSCHGPSEPDGGLQLTDEVTTYYNTSYEQLAAKELAGPIIPEFTSFGQGDRGNYNGAYLPPESLGSPRSVLLNLLTDPGHPRNAVADHSAILTPMEILTVTRWVDSNYQFYGGYYGRHHPRWVEADPAQPTYHPADFRRRPTFEEAVSNRAPVWHR